MTELKRREMGQSERTANRKEGGNIQLWKSIIKTIKIKKGKEKCKMV